MLDDNALEITGQHKLKLVFHRTIDHCKTQAPARSTKYIKQPSSLPLETRQGRNRYIRFGKNYRMRQKKFTIRRNIDKTCKMNTYIVLTQAFVFINY